MNLGRGNNVYKRLEWGKSMNVRENEKKDMCVWSVDFKGDQGTR